MRPSISRLASSVTSAPLTEASATILPPIPLYRRLLRVHRTTLPPEMRVMGDSYVKDEFRRCRSIEDPLQIIGFLSQWKIYLDNLEASPEGPGRIGKKLDVEVLEKMSPEQLGQLYELLQATKEVWVEPGQEGTHDEAVTLGEASPAHATEDPVVRGRGKTGDDEGGR